MPAIPGADQMDEYLVSSASSYWPNRHAFMNLGSCCFCFALDAGSHYVLLFDTTRPWGWNFGILAASSTHLHDKQLVDKPFYI